MCLLYRLGKLPPLPVVKSQQYGSLKRFPIFVCICIGCKTGKGTTGSERELQEESRLGYMWQDTEARLLESRKGSCKRVQGKQRWGLGEKSGCEPVIMKPIPCHTNLKLTGQHKNSEVPFSHKCLVTNVLNNVQKHYLVSNNNKIHPKNKLEEVCYRQSVHGDNWLFFIKTIDKLIEL